MDAAEHTNHKSHVLKVQVNLCLNHACFETCLGRVMLTKHKGIQLCPVMAGSLMYKCQLNLITGYGSNNCL